MCSEESHFLTCSDDDYGIRRQATLSPRTIPYSAHGNLNFILSVSCQIVYGMSEHSPGRSRTKRVVYEW